MNTVIRSFVYELPFDRTMIIRMFLKSLSIVFTSFTINICYKNVGQLHVQAKIRAAGEEVLNDLDQSVIIL